MTWNGVKYTLKQPQCSAFSSVSGKPCKTKSLIETKFCRYHTVNAAISYDSPICVRSRCSNPVKKNHTVCSEHTSGDTKVDPKRSKAIKIATEAMATYGKPIKKGINPFDALLEEIARTAGHVRWLEGIVQGLDPDELIWSKVEQESSIGEDPKGTYDVIKHAAVPHVWLQLYHKERAHLLQVCKVSIQCGLQERQVQLAEQQGDIIVRIFQKTFNDPDLGLTVEQIEAAKHSVGNNLRLLSGGSD